MAILKCKMCGGDIQATGSTYGTCGSCGSAMTLPKATDDQKANLFNRANNLGGYEWRVLDVQNDKALLLSDKIIESRPYNVEDKDITWENCTLRKYLNGEFYNKFGEAKSLIAETRNANNNNPWFGTNGGNATIDKIFLLSIEELVKYFGDSGQMKNRPQKPENFWIDDQYNSTRIAKDASGTAAWWFLRSPGELANLAALVGDVGRVRVIGGGVNHGVGGVRPALWLNL